MNTSKLTDRILELMESHGFTTDVDGSAHQLKIDIELEIETHLNESDCYNKDHEHYSTSNFSQNPF